MLTTCYRLTVGRYSGIAGRKVFFIVEYLCCSSKLG